MEYPEKQKEGLSVKIIYKSWGLQTQAPSFAYGHRISAAKDNPRSTADSYDVQHYKVVKYGQYLPVHKVRSTLIPTEIKS